MVTARLASLLACWALLGCSSDHDLLAARPEAPRPDSGPEGDDAANDVFPIVPQDGPAKMDVREPEPAGPWVLTLVNGVVDAEAIRFCFSPMVDGGELASDQPPTPTGGLPFGARIVVTTLGPINVVTQDVHPYVVVGATGANTALSCRQILGPVPADAAVDAGSIKPTA